MQTKQREGRGWMSFALAAGFVLLASGAALPDASVSLDALIGQVRALFV